MVKGVRNIFYTDDDPDDRDNFQEAFNEVVEGMHLFTQTSGVELMGVLHNPPPNPTLLFLDLNMPIKNGFEVLKEIRHKDDLKDLPVIIFSTSDDISNINASRQLGADLYIPKPNTYRALKKAILHGVSIDWDTHNPDEHGFVYRAE